MTYSVNGTNLDNFFEARSGTAIGSVGYSRVGVNLSTIYEGLEHDSQIPDIGYANNGTDLARLFKGNLLQYSTATRNTSTRSTAWNGAIIHDIRITFSSTPSASYFWQYGGRLMLTASRSGGSASLKNTTWTNLLNAAGRIEIAANATYRNTQTQVSTVGYNDIPVNGSYILLYTSTGSSPYTSALYRIFARRTLTNTMEIRVRFDDLTSEIIDENIDGTIQSVLTERRHPTAVVPSYSTLSNL
jgi:hypothetical protein